MISNSSFALLPNFTMDLTSASRCSAAAALGSDSKGMTRVAQEIEEERIARLLFAALGLGPIQSIRRGDPAPDIVACFSNRTIGLEITEIFAPPGPASSPYQAVENYRTALLEACATEWRHRQSPGSEVHVHFNPNVPIRKNRIRALASQLCDAVAGNLPAAEGYVGLEFDWGRRDSFLPEEVTAVHVVRFGNGDSHWLGPDSGYVVPLTIELVQGAIDRKALGDYREQGAESWLVIVANGLRISGAFDVPEAVIQHRYRAAFERMFLFELFSTRPYEIHAA